MSASSKNANVSQGKNCGTNDCVFLNFRAEMEEIKKEILSLSEKYSIKCVESANLEEELKSANTQLAQAQQQIIQLDSRYFASFESFRTYRLSFTRFKN